MKEFPTCLWVRHSLPSLGERDQRRSVSLDCLWPYSCPYRSLSTEPWWWWWWWWCLRSLARPRSLSFEDKSPDCVVVLRSVPRPGGEGGMRLSVNMDATSTSNVLLTSSIIIMTCVGISITAKRALRCAMTAISVSMPMSVSFLWDGPIHGVVLTPHWPALATMSQRWSRAFHRTVIGDGLLREQWREREREKKKERRKNWWVWQLRRELYFCNV